MALLPSLHFLLTGYACLLFPDFLIPYLMFLVICELLKTLNGQAPNIPHTKCPPPHTQLYHFRGQSYLQVYVWMPWDARHPELTMLFMDDFSTLESILQTQDSESGKINYAFSYKLNEPSILSYHLCATYLINKMRWIVHLLCAFFLAPIIKDFIVPTAKCCYFIILCHSVIYLILL